MKNSGFDYVALGHIHKAEQMVLDRVVMAGALEPVNHTEYGSHGYWMGEVDKEHCSVHFVPVRKCEYVPCGIYMTEEMGNTELTQKVTEALKEKESYQLLRIHLEGKYDPDITLETEELERLEGVVDISTKDLIPGYDYDKLKQDFKNELLGRYISTMERMPQNGITKRALFYGVDALCRAGKIESHP